MNKGLALFLSVWVLSGEPRALAVEPVEPVRLLGTASDAQDARPPAPEKTVQGVPFPTGYPAGE